MKLPTVTELDSAAELVYRHMQPSAQLEWPLLSERCGCQVLVKHENHNPTGAFKVRGGLVYINRLRQREPDIVGLVTATRGNHGQSVAFAASRHGMASVVVVPEGNNPDKNRAMQALGAELIVHGADFDEAVPFAQALAAERRLHRIPSFHMDLVSGVASYGLELFRSQPDLERVYVPIGLGSGICALVCARNALGLDTQIIGVVSSAADCYAKSLEEGVCISTESADTLADGMAVRVPSPEALDVMRGNVARVVRVDDDEVMAAMRFYFSDTHNVAEGAGAAPLAALLQEKALNTGSKVAVILSGGNVDAALYRQVLQH
ncbi:MAG: threonine dehydratase [Halioglobus sp.]